MVGVVGLHDYRVADVLCGAHADFDERTRCCFGTGKPRPERILWVSSLSDEISTGDVAGLACDGRLDALLVSSKTELHEALGVEPDPGNVAFLRRPHQRGRAGPQGAPLRPADQLIALLGEVEVDGDSTRGL